MKIQNGEIVTETLRFNLKFDLEELKHQRLKKGFDEPRMGYYLNISGATYKKKESGQSRITVEELAKLIEALEIDDVNILFKRDGSKK